LSPPGQHVPPGYQTRRQDSPPWEGFRQGLRELGYVEGVNVTIEWRWVTEDSDPVDLRRRLSLDRQRWNKHTDSKGDCRGEA